MKTIKVDSMGRSYLYKNGRKIAHYFCAQGHDKRVSGKRPDGTCLICHKKRLHENFIHWKINNRDEYIQKGRQSNWNKRGILNSDGKIFTRIDRDRAYQIQQGRCAICERHESDLKLSLLADHDHESKIFRGLLCNECNAGLGLLGDSRGRLKKALKYLSR